MRGLRAWVGFRQVGVPYVRPERMFGVSTNNLIRNLGWARRAIVSFSYAPLDFIISIALLVVGGSVAALLVSIGLKIASPSVAPKGTTTLIVVVLFIGGVQLLCIAIVGSYLAAMFEEIPYGMPRRIIRWRMLSLPSLPSASRGLERRICAPSGHRRPPRSSP